MGRAAALSGGEGGEGGQGLQLPTHSLHTLQVKHREINKTLVGRGKRSHPSTEPRGSPLPLPLPTLTSASATDERVDARCRSAPSLAIRRPSVRGPHHPPPGYPDWFIDHSLRGGRRGWGPLGEGERTVRREKGLLGDRVAVSALVTRGGGCVAANTHWGKVSWE